MNRKTDPALVVAPVVVRTIDAPVSDRLTKMRFYAYSRQAIERLQPLTVPHVIISIQTPGDPKAVAFRSNAFTRAVLHLAFDDIDEKILNPVPILGGGVPINLFNDEMARQVLEFVQAHKDAVEAIVAHCDHGVSRSVGLVMGLAEALFNQEDFMESRTPNMRVYHAILNARSKQPAAATS